MEGEEEMEMKKYPTMDEILTEAGFVQEWEQRGEQKAAAKYQAQNAQYQAQIADLKRQLAEARGARPR
jgi:hypothetical protein